MGKPVKLSSHDINVLSVIAQKATLPRDYLLTLAKTASISPDAVLVVKSLLKYPIAPPLVKISVKKRKSGKESSSSAGVSVRAAGKKAAAKKVAGDFRRWAASMK